MNIIRSSQCVLLALVAVALPAPRVEAGGGCVPTDGSTIVSFPTPDLNAPGFPTSATWSGSNRDGEPHAFDDDGLFSDDAMGAASNNGSTVSVAVTNSGGKLYGPNGADLGPAGCIEVYIVLTYDYVATITKCTANTMSIGMHGAMSSGSSSTSCITFEVHAQGSTSVGPQTVCPC